MFGRLLLLFIGIPLVELVLFLRIGSRIGLPATLGIIILTGILGAWLTRLQGMRTLGRFQKALAEGRLPHEEVLEGIMILIAGAVLLTPGFLTDAAGFLLLVPPVRAQLRRGLGRYLENRVQVVGTGMGTGAGAGAEIPAEPPFPAGQESPPPKRPGKGRIGDAVVIDATVIESDESKRAK